MPVFKQTPILTACLAGLTLTACSAGAGDKEKASPSTSFSAVQEGEIRSLVKDYLLENPEVLIEALNVYQDRQEIAADQQRQNAARGNLQALLNDGGGYETGADLDQAKIAVIEFFDYHCGYCKRATGLMQDLASKDKDVKLVFRELPILREESDIAARYALAARAQGKYADFHFRLMKEQGTLSEERLKKIAADMDMDVAALEKEQASDAIEKALQQTAQMAQDMGVSGTPAFVIAALDGSFVEVVPGFHAPSINAAIKQAKKAAK